MDDARMADLLESQLSQPAGAVAQPPGDLGALINLVRRITAIPAPTLPGAARIALEQRVLAAAALRVKPGLGLGHWKRFLLAPPLWLALLIPFVLLLIVAIYILLIPPPPGGGPWLTPTASATTTATTTATVTATPDGTPTATPDGTPTATPELTATATQTLGQIAIPTALPTALPTAVPTAAPAPATGGGTSGGDDDSAKPSNDCQGLQIGRDDKKCTPDKKSPDKPGKGG